MSNIPANDSFSLLEGELSSSGTNSSNSSWQEIITSYDRINGTYQCTPFGDDNGEKSQEKSLKITGIFDRKTSKPVGKYTVKTKENKICYILFPHSLITEILIRDEVVTNGERSINYYAGKVTIRERLTLNKFQQLCKDDSNALFTDCILQVDEANGRARGVLYSYVKGRLYNVISRSNGVFNGVRRDIADWDSMKKLCNGRIDELVKSTVSSYSYLSSLEYYSMMYIMLETGNPTGHKPLDDVLKTHKKTNYINHGTVYEKGTGNRKVYQFGVLRSGLKNLLKTDELAEYDIGGYVYTPSHVDGDTLWEVHDMDNEKVYKGSGKATDKGESSNNNGSVRQQLSSLTKGTLVMNYIDKKWEAKYDRKYHAQSFTEKEGRKFAYCGEVSISVVPWKIVPHGWGRFQFSNNNYYDGFFFNNRVMMCLYVYIDEILDFDEMLEHGCYEWSNERFVLQGVLGQVNFEQDGKTYYDLRKGVEYQENFISYPLNTEGSEVIRYSHKLFENGGNKFKYYIIIYQPIPDSNPNSSKFTIDVLTLLPNEYAEIDKDDNIHIYSIDNPNPLVTIPPRPTPAFFSEQSEEDRCKPVERMKVKHFVPFPFLCSCDCDTPCKDGDVNCVNADDNERFTEADLPTNDSEEKWL